MQEASTHLKLEESYLIFRSVGFVVQLSGSETQLVSPEALPLAEARHSLSLRSPQAGRRQTTRLPRKVPKFGAPWIPGETFPNETETSMELTKRVSGPPDNLR